MYFVPFNAWGAFIAGLIMAQGIENGFGELLKATLYNFYPMIVIITVIFVILSGKDIGEMKTAELRGSLLRKNAVPMMSSETAEVPMKARTKAIAQDT